MAGLCPSPLLPTFRDPAGSLELCSDGAYRRVHAPFDAEILAFLALPIASELVADGRLVSSEVVRRGDTEALVLRHPRVSFPSYPWEWPPALWLAAAELTLNLAGDLVKEGWLLKDATPLNVLFEGTRPVFVDVLSIQRAAPGSRLWLAYGQFVRTFLLPMLAHSQLGWPLEATQARRDGYEPEEIFDALPWRKRMRQPAFSTVTLPRLLSRWIGGAGKNLPANPAGNHEVAQQVLLKTLGTLLHRTRQAAPGPRNSAWSSYTETANHYSESDRAKKEAFVRETLDACRPKRVLDVGSNTGTYSIIAADAGAEVVSIDTDTAAVDRLAHSVKDKNILPLAIDLARPTPATGWQNREQASFLSRAAGHFDTVMMLAVIHHLLLGSQIPLESIAALVAELTTRNLIVEWVPPADPKYQEMLRGRDGIYAHITVAAFRNAFARHFTIARELTLANGRILFHFLRKKTWES